MSSKLFTNATIISFNDASLSIEILKDSDLLIEGDKITGLGKNLNAPKDVETIDATDKILTPGFVNTHSHLWQTAMRTLAPNTCLAEYLFNYSQIAPIAKSFSPSDIYTSTLAGYYEGLNGGVTSFVEHAHANWSLETLKTSYEAAVDGGARVWYCAAVQDGEGVSADSEWAWLAEEAQKRRELVRLGLAWDFLGAMDEGTVNDWKAKIIENNLEALTIHHLGSPWPTPNSGPETTAKHSFQPDLDIPIIFSHAGFITPEEQALLRKHDWHLSITPESEQHYGHGQVSSRTILEKSSLGVDTNFTFSGDLLTQARLALQSFRHAAYAPTLEAGKIPSTNPMAVDEAFLLATRQGGLALRRPDIGVLKVGAKADVVVFDGTSPNMAGWTDPVAAVILHANVGDIRDVVVGGDWRKKDGELVVAAGDGGWAEWRKEFEGISRRIQGEMTQPAALEGKLFGVTDYGEGEVMTTKGKY